MEKFYKTLLVLLICLCGGMMSFSSRKASVSADLQQEISNLPLSVIGEVPGWLSGTLVRNGPVNVHINGKSNPHWFDGLAMLHAFSFHEGKVHYTNRFLRSDAYRTVFKEKSLNYGGFASDPCRSLFKRFLTFFFPPSHLAIHNANVNVAKLADQYVALTEVPLPVRFDPHTLETLGVFDYQDELPKERCWESAHPHEEVDQKIKWNYLIQFGPISYYTLYKMQKDSSERKVVAQIPVHEPAYMHSFAMTENYAIFTEFPLVVNPLDLIMKGKPFIKNFTWQPERGTCLTVVNRHNGNLVGQYVTKPFFAFHHVNAFEQNGSIHMDVVTYPSAKILTGKSFYVTSNESLDADQEASRLERLSLSPETGEIHFEILFSKPIEFPRINEKLDGKAYRFVCLFGGHA